MLDKKIKAGSVVTFRTAYNTLKHGIVESVDWEGKDNKAVFEYNTLNGDGVYWAYVNQIVEVVTY